jgi:hypothetical protein
MLNKNEKYFRKKSNTSLLYFMLLRMACSVDSEARVTVYAVQYFLALYFGI